MKTFQRLLLSAGAAIMLMPPISASAVGEVPSFDVAVNAPPQVVFIGDSITAGYGLEGYLPDDMSNCDSFANLLALEFKAELPEQADFCYFNEGLDGRTSAGMLKLLQSGKLDDELKAADAVVVSVGGNDMLDTFLDIFNRDNSMREIIEKALSLSDDLDSDLEGFAQNMPLIAEELDKRTDGIIFVQTLYNPMEATPIKIINNMSAEKIGRLNEIIAECSENGSKYKLCDVSSEFVGRASELTNIDDYDIHPNAAGHRVIAELMSRVLHAETYYYHDYEAEREYLLEQERLAAEQERLEAMKREQEEIETARREQSRKTRAAAAAGCGVMLVLGALLIRRGKQDGGSAE